jgi:hypothetical protein
MARLIEAQPMKGRVFGEPKGISQRASIKPSVEDLQLAREEAQEDYSLCRPIIPNDQVVKRRQWPRPSKTK